MAQLIATFRTNDTLQSGARFVFVGMLGTLIDLSLFAVLHLFFGAPALLANSLSYSAGMINNYFLHRLWTFGQRPRIAAGRQFSFFALISLSALAMNNLIIWLLTPPFTTLLSDPAQAAIFAKICAIGVGMGWNFIANHRWTFRAD